MSFTVEPYTSRIRVQNLDTSSTANRLGDMEPREHQAFRIMLGKTVVKNGFKSQMDADLYIAQHLSEEGIRARYRALRQQLHEKLGQAEIDEQRELDMLDRLDVPEILRAEKRRDTQYDDA